MSHLLSLPELHAEAPGVLNVVFGADGEFLLAPMFRPPLWHADGYWVWRYQVDDLVIQPLALDLRVPSVAARLAGLCARALGAEQDQGWAVLLRGIGGWALCCADGERWFWDEQGRAMHVGPDVKVGRNAEPAAFLRALTIALAPRIRDLSRRES